MNLTLSIYPPFSLLLFEILFPNGIANNGLNGTIPLEIGYINSLRCIGLGKFIFFQLTAGVDEVGDAEPADGRTYADVAGTPPNLVVVVCPPTVSCTNNCRGCLSI